MAKPDLEAAIALAIRVHRGQVYPSPEREPYVLHPLRVMLAVTPGPAQIVAMLHDVVEDTHVTLDNLKQRGYPNLILSAIDALSRRRGESYERYIKRAAANELAKEVKLADLYDNLANNRRLPPTAERRVRILRYQRARKILDAGKT